MKTQIDLDEIARCHCLATRRIARELTRMFDEALRPHGLRATQFSVLVALARRGATPVNRLADALGMDRTTLTRSTSILTRRGWVGSEVSDDARVRPLRLTAAGMRKLEAAYPAWRAAQERAEAKLRDVASALAARKPVGKSDGGSSGNGT